MQYIGEVFSLSTEEGQIRIDAYSVRNKSETMGENLN